MAQAQLNTDPKLQAAEVRPSSTPGQLMWKRFMANRRAMAGLVVVVLLFLVAIFAPVLAPMDPYEQNLALKIQPPSPEHRLGMDELGRDVLSRLIYGSRVSLQVGFMTVGISLVIGVTLGALAGYYGGWVDTLIMRITDVVLAFPGIILAIAMMAVLGASLINVTIALAIVRWTGYCRQVRGAFLSLRETEYVQGARSIGARDWRIILKHLLPNSLTPIIVQASMGMAGAIVSEAGLSFLGLGAQPPTASWGSMLSGGRAYQYVAPHLTTYAGIAIMITVLGFNLLGDGLRDALDPRQTLGVKE